MKKPNFPSKKSHSSSPRQPLPRKKKALGQNFLRKQSTVDNMIARVVVNQHSHVLEIGCGDGFLTKSILGQTPCKKLLCFEIDHEWATVVRNTVKDERLDLREQNILDVQEDIFKDHQPLVVLANLPYQITFPIFFLFLKYKHHLQEGVVMVQEEVAQKIVAQRGKSYNATSMLLQYHFEVELMEKVEPGAFSPPPKVYSRLVYFKPKKDIIAIPDEENFWKFVKLCFKSPRQTLKNNLRTTHYPLETFSQEILAQRAQQLSFEDFLQLWEKIA